MGHAYISFLSDYGWTGGYVAACEATVASIAPSARVLHISHEVALGDVRNGGTVLARVAPLGPVAIHLAVVDPGVGTARGAVVVHATRGDYLVGPDNGLLIPAVAALGGAAAAWLLDARSVRTQAGLTPAEPSNTFHGRDVFAPAAALLATGLTPTAFGRPLEADALLQPPAALVEIGDRGARSEITEIDRFGNVALAVGLSALDLDDILELRATVEEESEQDWRCRVVTTFSDLKPGELGIFQDSWGRAGLALNGASAAELLGARLGGTVMLTPLEAGGDEQAPSAEDRPKLPGRAQ